MINNKGAILTLKQCSEVNINIVKIGTGGLFVFVSFFGRVSNEKEILKNLVNWFEPLAKSSPDDPECCCSYSDWKNENR